MLRIACGSDKLQSGMRHVVGEGDMMFEFTVEVQGRWKDEHFTRFELTNDYEMKGIDNLYHTYGLGVPLIAVPDSSETTDPTANYYPPRLTVPLTAFCEVLPPEETTDSGPPITESRVEALRSPGTNQYSVGGTNDSVGKRYYDAAGLSHE